MSPEFKLLFERNSTGAVSGPMSDKCPRCFGTGIVQRHPFIIPCDCGAEPKQEEGRNMQVTHLAEELDKLIERFRSEYSISYAEVVGSLMMKAHLLMVEAEERDDD